MENGRFEPWEDLRTCQAKTSGKGRMIIACSATSRRKGVDFSDKKEPYPIWFVEYNLAVNCETVKL
jgi:hypothetical protein